MAKKRLQQSNSTESLAAVFLKRLLNNLFREPDANVSSVPQDPTSKPLADDFNNDGEAPADGKQ